MILTVIVTYNPDNNLYKILHSLKQQQTKILVIDNNSENKLFLYNLKKKLDIDFVFNKKNIGIASSQNIGISYAKRMKYTHILFLDQDTRIPQKFIETMTNSWNLMKDRNIGILAPNYVNKIDKKEARFPIIHHNGYTLKTMKDRNFMQVYNVVSSGMMVSLDVINKIGNMKDYFFIDQVDTDFCYRVIEEGFKIFVTSYATLEHDIGKPKIFYLFGRRIKVNNHSPERKFFFARNSVYVLKESKSNKGFRKYIWHQLVYMIILTLFFENKKTKKIFKIIQGIIQGELDGFKKI